ncbi:MAG: hypothetical protein ACE5FG_13630, partial [Myxococcota bacterium]
MMLIWMRMLLMIMRFAPPGTTPRLWLAAIGASLLFASPLQAGVLDTPLPTFSDGTPSLRVGLLPAAVKANLMESHVICTNLEDVPVHIGLEIFPGAGGVANSISQGNGAALNVAPGATVSLATGNTALLTEDVV